MILRHKVDRSVSDETESTAFITEEKASYREHGMAIHGNTNLWKGARILLCCALTFAVLVATFCNFGKQDNPRESTKPNLRQVSSLTKRATADTATSPLLRNFQVSPPVLTPFDNGVAVLTNGSADGLVTSVNVASKGCVKQIVLMEHVFAYSYGIPFVGELVL